MVYKKMITRNSKEDEMTRTLNRTDPSIHLLEVRPTGFLQFLILHKQRISSNHFQECVSLLMTMKPDRKTSMPSYRLLSFNDCRKH